MAGRGGAEENVLCGEVWVRCPWRWRRRRKRWRVGPRGRRTQQMGDSRVDAPLAARVPRGAVVLAVVAVAPACLADDAPVDQREHVPARREHLEGQLAPVGGRLRLGRARADVVEPAVRAAVAGGAAADRGDGVLVVHPQRLRLRNLPRSQLRPFHIYV